MPRDDINPYYAAYIAAQGYASVEVAWGADGNGASYIRWIDAQWQAFDPNWRARRWRAAEFLEWLQSPETT